MSRESCYADRSVRCSDRSRRSPHEALQLAGLWPKAAPGSQPVSGLLQAAAAPESSRTGGSAPGPSEGRGHPANGNNSKPATRSQIERLGRRLTDRDHFILEGLRLHHYLTTRQLQQFHFEDHDTGQAAARICRRTLARLSDLGVIEHLDRRVGGIRAGSAAYIWRVGLRGDRLLRADHPERARARRKEPSLRFLDHCLAVADAHLGLRLAAQLAGGELLRLETEPDCWRRFVRASGASDVLKPDLAAITSSGEFEDHWFVEVDRATESLPTVLKKCLQYQAYRRSGSEQQRLGIFPRLLWLVPDDDRADKLRRALATELDGLSLVVGTLPQLPAIIAEGAE